MVPYRVAWIPAIAWCLLAANFSSWHIHSVSWHCLAESLPLMALPCMGIGKKTWIIMALSWWIMVINGIGTSMVLIGTSTNRGTRFSLG